MKRRLSPGLALTGLTVALALFAGCNSGTNLGTGGGSGGGGGGGGGRGGDGNIITTDPTPTPTPTSVPTATPTPTSTPTPTPVQAPNLAIVKTATPVYFQARIAACGDLVVFGTGLNNGVSYLDTSEANPAVHTVPNSANYSSTDFAVAGKKIALVDVNHQVTIFDTVAQTSTLIPAEDVYVENIPGSTYALKNLQADGDYIAVMTNGSKVTDQNRGKVIDVSGDPPTVISFPYKSGLKEAMVDSQARLAVFTDSNVYHVFELDNPSATRRDIDAGAIGEPQAVVHNPKALYGDYNNHSIHMVDLGNKTRVDLANGLACLESLAFNADRYSFFMARDNITGMSYLHRSVIGSILNAPDNIPATKGIQVDGTSDAHGWVGYGRTTAITPDGQYIFIAGWEDINAGEYLQVSTGGGFALLQSPDGDAWGFPASDVTCSDRVVAFKGGSGQNTVVCYIRLP